MHKCINRANVDCKLGISRQTVMNSSVIQYSEYTVDLSLVETLFEWGGNNHDLIFFITGLTSYILTLLNLLSFNTNRVRNHSHSDY